MNKSSWELAGQAAAVKALGLAPKVETMESNGLPLNESKFPALVEVDGTLKILDHHELPVGVSFRIVETAPLTPANVLATTLKWSFQKEKDAVLAALADHN